MAYIAVSDSSSLLGLVAPRRLFKFRELKIVKKYILYARKSTDVEDKQVLSIEAQLVELRAYAKNEGLQIVDELIEKQSAKTPGRPIFGSMLKRIETSRASGIIAWHPDRLARNSMGGGQIVYLLDQVSHLQSLKFPTFLV